MKRVLFGIMWAVVLYFVGSVIVGGIAGGKAGVLEKEPQRAAQIGAKAGAEAADSLRLVILGGAVGLAIVGSVMRILPGTKQPPA